MTDHEINAFASATALAEAEASFQPQLARHFIVNADGTETEVTEVGFATSEGTVATAADVTVH